MNKPPPRLIACDVGTNGVRMQVWQAVQKDGKDHIVGEATYRVPVRLGEDVFSSGAISKTSASHLAHTFHAFAHLKSIFSPRCFRAVATSAMRDAKNGRGLADQILSETGIELEIIDGDEEAELSLLAHAANPDLSEGLYLCVDVGGGSTQLSVLRDGRSIARDSFRIGAVRLLEGKVEDSEWDRLQSWLQDLPKASQPERGIAVGGNAEKLLELSGGKSHQMSRKELHKLWDELAALSGVDRMLEFELKPDRADVIVEAAHIYYQSFKWLDVKDFCVPGTGIREGMVVSMFQDVFHRTPVLSLAH
ncbi:MAG: Ppx/GppA family phosphatase [Fibrobacteres bacterium]|nr:Ppx/GppA family phosphatase [Fibrobacterota bacterium]